ncbi:MAG: type II TA system antitoxin MqsA family protein [Acidobacteriota bacterium]
MVQLKCDICNGTTSTRVGRYHYTESGLDNLYLDNVTIYKCKKCAAETAAIPRLNQLHRTIGVAIALKPGALVGNEIKFLHKYLGIKAKDFAAHLRVDISTFSRWENGEQQIGPQSDLLIRLLFFRLLEEKEGKFIREPLVEQFADSSGKTESFNLVINTDKNMEYEYA